MKHWVFCTVLIVTGIMSWNSAAWSQETKPITLIQGLDGGDYEPYAPRVMERVQEALRSQGLYSGEVNGLLDEATMEALGEFQKQHGLQVCGVPTPSTRRALFQSSPTPP